MATLDINILEAAHTDGLIIGRLSDRQRLYLALSVITVNEILRIIQECGERGAGVEGLAQATELHPNTIKQYCRWLRSKGLIESEAEGQGGAIAYYAKE